MSALAYATENNYDMLSKFKTVKEFNNHFEQAMLLYKKHFTKSEYIALNNLRHFAGSDIPGVAWCRLIKAVSATFKDSDFGVSRRTHERMLLKAQEINLITIYNQERKNGSQKHSVYVFNRIEELVAPVSKEVKIVSKSTTIDVSNATTIDVPISLLLYLPEIKRLKDIKNTYQPPAEPSANANNLINFKQETTPRNELKALVANLFSDAKIPNRLYGTWLAQTNKLFNKPSFDLAKQATMILTNEVRRRSDAQLKPLNNPVGYFNGILGNLIDKWVESETRSLEDNYEYNQSDDLAVEMDLTMQDNWLENREDGPAWLYWD